MITMGWDTYWFIALGLGFGTLALRFSFIFTLEKLSLPDWLPRVLALIPAAVLPALVVPAIVLHQGEVAWSGGNERILAGLVACLVAWRTKNMLATIFTGLICLYLVKYFA